MRLTERFTRLTDKQRGYILAAILSVINLAVIFIFDISTLSFEFRAISVMPVVICSLLYFAQIPLCLVLRFTRRSWIARGMFLYQLVGGFAYALYFVGFVAGQGSTAFFNGCYSLFRWWTLMYEPACVILCRLIGFPVKYTMGMLYLVLIYMSAATISAIRKDIKFEERLAAERNERDEFEKDHGSSR